MKRLFHVAENVCSSQVKLPILTTALLTLTEHSMCLLSLLNLPYVHSWCVQCLFPHWETGIYVPSLRAAPSLSASNVQNIPRTRPPEQHARATQAGRNHCTSQRGDGPTVSKRLVRKRGPRPQRSLSWKESSSRALRVFAESWKLRRYCGTFHYYNLLAAQKGNVDQCFSWQSFLFCLDTRWPECLHVGKRKTLCWVSGWEPGPPQNAMPPYINALCKGHKSSVSRHSHQAPHRHLVVQLDRRWITLQSKFRPLSTPTAPPRDSCLPGNSTHFHSPPQHTQSCLLVFVCFLH